jgi:hypothetical protein
MRVVVGMEKEGLAASCHSLKWSNTPGWIHSWKGRVSRVSQEAKANSAGMGYWLLY